MDTKFITSLYKYFVWADYMKKDITVGINTLQKIAMELIMRVNDLTFDDLVQYDVLSYSWPPNIKKLSSSYTPPKSINDLSHHEAAKIISEYYEK